MTKLDIKNVNHDAHEMLAQFKADTDVEFSKLLNEWEDADALCFNANVQDTAGIILEFARITLTKRDFKLFEKEINSLKNEYLSLVGNIYHAASECAGYGGDHYKVKGVW